MKLAHSLLLALLVSGCAGSPRYIANASNSRPINVDGQSFYVLNEGGVWMATYQDIIAKGFFPTEADIFRQKLGLTRAIEAASGCKVSSSSQEPSLGISMQATVDCSNIRLAPQPVRIEATPVRPIAPIQSKESVPFTPTKDSYLAAALARSLGCAEIPDPALAGKAPGVEIFTISCKAGTVMTVRCEYGQCRELR